MTSNELVSFWWHWTKKVQKSGVSSGLEPAALMQCFGKRPHCLVWLHVSKFVFKAGPPVGTKISFVYQGFLSSFAFFFNDCTDRCVSGCLMGKKGEMRSLRRSNYIMKSWRNPTCDSWSGQGEERKRRHMASLQEWRPWMIDWGRGEVTSWTFMLQATISVQKVYLGLEAFKFKSCKRNIMFCLLKTSFGLIQTLTLKRSDHYFYSGHCLFLKPSWLMSYLLYSSAHHMRLCCSVLLLKGSANPTAQQSSTISFFSRVFSVCRVLIDQETGWVFEKITFTFKRSHKGFILISPQMKALKSTWGLLTVTLTWRTTPLKIKCTIFLLTRSARSEMLCCHGNTLQPYQEKQS